MPGKAPFTKQGTITELRRSLFYTYGDLVFQPRFDLALRYSEAIKFARGEPIRHSFWDDNLAPDTAALFAALHKQIGDLVLAHGPAVMIDIGSLLSDIAAYENNPHKQNRSNIQVAHLMLCLESKRPPTLEELREKLWRNSALPEARRRTGTLENRAAQSFLDRAWSDEPDVPEFLPRVMDAKQLKRLTEEMRIDLFDGRVLTRYRRCFDALKEKLGRKPTKDEFLAQSRPLASKTRKPLRETTFQDFIDFLTVLQTRTENGGWHVRGGLRDEIREYLTKAARAPNEASGALLLCDSVVRLDIALDELRSGMPEGKSSDLSESATLTKEFTHLVSELRRLPWVEDVLIRCEPETLSAIAQELHEAYEKARLKGKLPVIPDEPLAANQIESAWQWFQGALKKQEFSGAVPLAFLIDKMPEMRLLTQGLERYWSEFWSRILWEEFARD